MPAICYFRILAHVLAPLCASPAEGAKATELRQDKRGSLRPCPAVRLSFPFNAFTQAAILMRSLSLAASLCDNAPISTSSALCHVG